METATAYSLVPVSRPLQQPVSRIVSSPFPDQGHHNRTIFRKHRTATRDFEMVESLPDRAHGIYNASTRMTYPTANPVGSIVNIYT